MNLSAVDLNLFLVLHTVLEEGSATRAAKKLHVTQSAVSNSLGRLRQLLGDPLVVRSGRGVVATPLARELAPMVAAAMQALGQAVAVERSFDPLATTRTFTIASTDAELIVDLPEVAALVAERMPKATLRAVSLDYLLSTDGLATGTVDLVLGYARGMDPSWYSHPLYVERPALVVRRDHPTLGTHIGREEFEGHLHIDVHVQLGNPGAGNQDARKALEGQQLRREVRLIVPGFTAAALAAARTDYIAGIPRRLAETFCKYLPLRIVEMAGFDFGFPAALCWHERTHLDPAAVYLRALVVEALSPPRRESPTARGSRRAKTSGTSARRPARPKA